MIAVALTLLAMMGDPVKAYQFDISVARDGAAIMSASTQIMIDEPMHLTASTSMGGVELAASLDTIQGDGDAELLMLNASASMDGDTLVEPSATLMRGQPFSFHADQPDGSAILIRLTPIVTD